MRKNKKESWQPGPQGMFYDSKKCFVCGKLIWGSSPQSHKLAKKDCYSRMKAHREECQSNQLNLSLPGKEGEHNEIIRRVTIRGKKKSV